MSACEECQTENAATESRCEATVLASVCADEVGGCTRKSVCWLTSVYLERFPGFMHSCVRKPQKSKELCTCPDRARLAPAVGRAQAHRFAVDVSLTLSMTACSQVCARVRRLTQIPTSQTPHEQVVIDVLATRSSVQRFQVVVRERVRPKSGPGLRGLHNDLRARCRQRRLQTPERRSKLSRRVTCMRTVERNVTQPKRGELLTARSWSPPRPAGPRG